MAGYATEFESAGKRTDFPHGAEYAIEVFGKPVTLVRFEPGWRWTTDLKAMVGTERCPLLHTGYLLSGRLHIEPEQGEAFDVSAGELFVVEPGHDAWVVGDEGVALLDWAGHAREVPGGAR